MAYGNIAASFGKRWNDEDGDSLLQPHLVLPEQFVAAPPCHAAAERRLLAAILTEAVTCFQRLLFAEDAHGRRLFREAEQWIMETEYAPSDAGTYPYFSFEQVCAGLALDSAGVRGRLREWSERQRASGRRPDRPSLRQRALKAGAPVRAIRAHGR